MRAGEPGLIPGTRRVAHYRHRRHAPAASSSTATARCVWCADRDACAFAYRDSVFKHQAGPCMAQRRVSCCRATAPAPGLMCMRNSTRWASPRRPRARWPNRIRRTQAAGPGRGGQCGSFFKNPIVSQADALLVDYPTLPVCGSAPHNRKLSAAWKGHRDGGGGRLRCACVGQPRAGHRRRAGAGAAHREIRARALRRGHRAGTQDHRRAPGSHHRACPPFPPTSAPPC